MPLAQAKCTNCGATLEVENTMDAAICPYCGAAYVVEKAVNYFNTTNNIRADVVNIYGENYADFVIRAGTLEKYTGAATDVVIPNSVTIIGSGAFQGCSGLTSVIIPNSVTSIGGCAFSDCSGLASVTIPNSITSIGGCAFSGCSGLISVTIPNSVTSIDFAAFSNCSGLTNVTIPNSVTSIGDSAFLNCSGLASVTIPNSVTSLGLAAFSNCSGLANVTIPNSVTSIGGCAFSGCSGLTSVTIPDSVTRIGGGGDNATFYGCDRLTTIHASETWKREHWDCAKCLWSYRPIPSSTSSGGCYIASAVYGSYDCPQVWALRRYRDNTLASVWYGRIFIHTYYAVSPTLVSWFGHTRWFRSFWRKHLDRLVSRLKDSGTEDTPYQDITW